MRLGDTDDRRPVVLLTAFVVLLLLLTTPEAALGRDARALCGDELGGRLLPIDGGARPAEELRVGAVPVAAPVWEE